jgi:hypothetical protein
LNIGEVLFKKPGRITFVESRKPDSKDLKARLENEK